MPASPAGNTVASAVQPRIDKGRLNSARMPYSPEPTPPKITSPNCMLTRGTIPPKGKKLSCIELTAPHEVSVVTVAHEVESAGPKRTSLPSMLPPACIMLGVELILKVLRAGLPCASDQ